MDKLAKHLMPDCASLPLVAVMAVAASFLVSTSPSHAEQAGGPKWHPWFEIGGYYNSDDANRGEVTMFAPITQGHSSLAFIDARGKFFEDDIQEGNFAIGYRQMRSSGFNYGAWIGGDVRNTGQSNTFWQLSGGFEALSRNFDARLNWYGPINDPKTALGDGSFTQVRISGNSIFMVGGEEVGLHGVDAELGFRIPLEVLQLDPDMVELRVYGGGYYFDHDEALEEIAGVSARAELAFNDVIPNMPGSRLTAEYQFSRDDVRSTRHEIGARLRIPFGGSSDVRSLRSLTGQERRMLSGLERDTDIITAQSEAEPIEDAITQTDFDRVAMVSSGGSISTTSATAGDNSLLVVNGNVTGGTQTVQANQTVQGAGSTIQVRGRNSGVVIGFRAPGSMPTVTNPGGGNVLRMVGDNTHVAGLMIDGQGNGSNGINGANGKTNMAVTQNVIRNTGSNGIRFGNDNSQILVQDNTIENTVSNEGIDFGDRNTDVTVDRNTIQTPNSDGILFNNDNRRITVTNNNISGGVDQGIEFDDRNSDIVIEGNTISDFNDEGINIDDNNSNIRIANNTIFDVDDEGIEFSNGNTNVTIVNNNIMAGDDAILFDGANNANRNTNILISGNTIVAGGNDEGIQFDDGNQNITITNNTITAGDDGIQFDNDNTGLTISGNSITSTTEDGIEMDNNNTGTISGNTFVAANGDGVNLNNGNTFTIRGNTFGAIGDDAIRINANNSLTIAANIFNGPIGGQLLDVDGAGTNTLAGVGNISNVAVTCQSGTFAGTVEVSGVILQDGVAPCN